LSPVNNDFHNTYNLFELFKDLNVKDLDVELTADSKPQENGSTDGILSETTKN
jgi:methylenetetrahydrofolate reductase (NADPH)